MKVLTNALGISDSGGITVLHKYLEEINNSSYSTVVCYSQGPLMEEAISRYQGNKKLLFISFTKKGFFQRFWIEHFDFKKIINLYNINLIYNISGSAQFLPIKQLIKLQNLMFFSEKLDAQYKQQGKWSAWLKQVYIKRHIFLNLYRFKKNFEIQSGHVKELILNYNHSTKRIFYIKSDIDLSDNSFFQAKNYDFSKKISFLFIIGPHFQMIHKNLKDFIQAMVLLHFENENFEIVITLSEKQLSDSDLWDCQLTPLTRFIGYVSKNELQTYFKDNTILVSTSIIETLGLHVIEAIKQGCLCIVPEENYSRIVYGNNMIFYETNNPSSLKSKISLIKAASAEECRLIIHSTQKDLQSSERSKLNSITDIFDTILNGQKS